MNLQFTIFYLLGAESTKSVSQHLSASNIDSMNNSLELSSVISNESSSEVYPTVPMALSKVVQQINNIGGEGCVTSVQSEEYMNRESDEDDLDASGEGIIWLLS